MTGDLSGGACGAKEARRGPEEGAKNRKGGALGPRLPVRCRASRPFGTISSATARPFGPCFTSRCYDVASALAGLTPISGGICGAKYPDDSASRYCGDAARPWHFALTHPSALSRPWQWATVGLPAPPAFPPFSPRPRLLP